ncbi:MAG: hypothetical protein QM802_25135 [Agriterribacter sp.]
MSQRNEKSLWLRSRQSIFMSLKNITLTSETLANLYSMPLVAVQAAEEIKPVANAANGLKFLGSNTKNITILVNVDDAPFINDKAFQFLTGILNACKLNMADVALINISKLSDTGYTSIYKITSPAATILFDVAQQDIGLPLQFPHFQVQKYSNVSYLSAPPLAVIEADKSLKSMLWGSLKSLFQL